MASDLWNSLAGQRRIRWLSARPYRAVESQHLVSTRKLVDTDGEHEVLEALIESRKPALPKLDSRALHYLLTTPFRYPPLPHGSRFGTRLEPGIWYGSLERHGVFAETAYYRLLFVEGSKAQLTPLELEFTVFRVRVKTRRGIDLTTAPFARYEGELSSKESYGVSQALGKSMREAGVEAFKYRSARDSLSGTNLAVTSPRAFAERRPSDLETWWCRVEESAVDFVRKSHFERGAMRFSRDEFLVRGRLPAPSV